MKYHIVTAPTLHSLQADMKAVDGHCVGAPFWNPQLSVWCQAVIEDPKPENPGEVRLKEPRRPGR